MEMLQSSRFADRRAATRILRAMGKSGHSVLQSIADSGDSESATRAIDLLKEGVRSPDPEIAESARASLRGLVESDGPLASSAEEALQKPDHDRPVFRLPQQPNLRPMRPPAFAPKGRTNLRISIRIVNDVREIEVIQNDKRYRFRDAGAGIETERPDGKGSTKKRTYRTAEELRQRDPEAYQAYQKSGGSTGVNGGGRGPMLLPGLFGNGLQAAPLPRRVGPDSPPSMSEPKPPSKPGPRIELHPEIAPKAVPIPKKLPKPDRIEV
jgi:hypothetical protein